MNRLKSFLRVLLCGVPLVAMACKGDKGTGPGPEPGNQDPVAVFSYTRPTYVGAPITFDASNSYDPDGNIQSVLWSFSDGDTPTGLRVQKTKTSPTTLTVTLTVTDNDGATASVTGSVAVKWSGASGDCGYTDGYYGLLAVRWPSTSGLTNVAMYVTDAYRRIDPSYVSVGNNAALRAMGELHWSSNAKISFTYFLALQNRLEAADAYNCITTGTLGEQVLAHTAWWSRNNVVTEVDVVVNTRHPWGTNGSSDTYDLESVLTHEFGHVWRLDDLSGSDKCWETMYESMGKGDTHGRTLYCGDKKGLQRLYGYYVRSAAEYELPVDAPILIAPQPTVTVSNEYTEQGMED